MAIRSGIGVSFITSPLFIVLIMFVDFLLPAFRTVHLVTTGGSSRRTGAEDPALSLPLAYPAVATTTVTPVTRKLGSVW